MDKKYINPPILEAVCEIKFDESSEWDPTIPGILYSKIMDDFPKKKSLQQHEYVFNLDTQNDSEGGQKVKIRERAQFLRDDEKLFIQVDENLLAINYLKPYSSWEEFFAKIKIVYEAYLEIAKPKGIERIGLRYVNQIEIPVKNLEIEEYFNFRPFIDEKMPQDLESCMAGVLFRFNNGQNKIKVSLSDKPTLSGDVCFLLDLDYFLAIPNSVELNNVIEWIDNGHNEIEKFFEASVTDKTKELFDKI